MYIEKTHIIKYGEKYFVAAIAAYDTETYKIVASLEIDYLSETLEESSDYIMEFIKQKYPEPRYSGHSAHVQEFCLAPIIIE